MTFTLSAQLFDDRICDLGEGVFWHPARAQLFWFDITAGLLHSRDVNGPQQWKFATPVSAAGWIDSETLMIASVGALLRLDLKSGTTEPLAPLDCSGGLRSNDGRADPQGGFWIGTMGLSAQNKAGAIWRYYRGEMRKLFDRVTIPNAICFTPDGEHACFTDTPSQILYRQKLDKNGWPVGEPEPWLNLRKEGLNPDGAVIDAEGRLWLAQWGAGRIAAYDREATLLGVITSPAPHASCPGFGGADLSTLYVTTARQGMDAAACERSPQAGMTFATDLSSQAIRGQAEHKVIL